LTDPLGRLYKTVFQTNSPARYLALSCSYSYTYTILTDLIDFLVTQAGPAWIQEKGAILALRIGFS
jgi:hypothetical protein